jgi:glycyl-tRNA synthetase beta chain
MTTICNIESKDPVQVIAGNERVIRPRLSDAAFFFDTDRKTRLADRVEQLKNIVFQQRLGTLYDKTRRVENLAGSLAEGIGAPVEQSRRAAPGRPAQQDRPGHRHGAGIRRYAGHRRFLLRPARW